MTTAEFIALVKRVSSYNEVTGEGGLKVEFAFVQLILILVNTNNLTEEDVITMLERTAEAQGCARPQA